MMRIPLLSKLFGGPLELLRAAREVDMKSLATFLASPRSDELLALLALRREALVLQMLSDAERRDEFAWRCAEIDRTYSQIAALQTEGREREKS